MVQAPTIVLPWQAFAVAYARALQAAGEATPDVEEEVVAVLAARGVEATVMATPTALWVDVDGVSRVVRTAPAGPRLDVAAGVRAVGASVAAGALSPAEALPLLSARLADPGPYGGAVRAAAFAATSAAAAILLGGGLADAWVAGGLGLAVISLAVRLKQRPGWERLADPASAAAASASAGLLGWLFAWLGWHTGLDPRVASLAAVVALVPGLQLTLGAAEAASGHWTSGAARSWGSAANAVMLAGGLAIPFAVLPALPPPVHAPVPGWAQAAAVGVGAIAIAVSIRTLPRNLAPAALIAAVAVGLAVGVGGPAGAALGAGAATVAANLWARRLGAVGLGVPALLLLVPGALGVRGAGLLIGRDVVPGLETVVSAGVVATAIAAGLLLGHALVGRPAARGIRARR